MRTGANGDPANADDAYAAYLDGVCEPGFRQCPYPVYGLGLGPPEQCVLEAGHEGGCEL